MKRTVIFNVVLTLILLGTLGFNYQQERLLREDIAHMQGSPPSIGAEVPEVFVVDETGEKVRLNDFYQDHILLVLWNTKCQPSIWALQALSEISGEGAKMQIMPVSTADSITDAKGLFEQMNWEFPVFVDADKSIKWAFKANISPALYLINSEGIIVHRQLGLSEQGLEFLTKWM